MAETFSFSLDGAPVTVEADPKASALTVLREQLAVRGCKAGCAPQGLCGACTVLVDGKPRLTCTLPTKSLAGKTVLTLDGLPEADRHLLAGSFVAAGATQCGYCTPGIALSAWALLSTDPAPGTEAITRALGLHVCRCTGYAAIEEAIDTAARARRGEVAIAPCDRPEGAAIVLGERPFVDDLVRPGMVFGAVVLAPVARGRVARVELGEAEGVVLRGPGEALLHAGDIVAAVVGPDAAAARRAAAAVVVEVEPELDALAPSAVPLARARRADGDADAALRACAHRVEGTWRAATTDPVFLEPEAALAVPVRGDDGAPRLVVYSAGHDASALAAGLGDALGVPVRVVLVPSGGSYGGKEAPTVELVAARLAVATGRPVRLALAHEEGMRVHRRRPGAEVRVRAGCGADGSGLVLDVSARFDGGADAFGADAVASRAVGAVPYTGTVVVDARVEASDAPPTGPIRGAGGLAVSFAVERALDRLAALAGLDAFALRVRNLEGEAAAVLGALDASWAPGRGVALGRVDGGGGARVVLTVDGPGSVEVQCNVPELGQGRDETLLAALVAATGLSADAFTFAWGDSAVVGGGAPASAPVERAAARAGAALRAPGEAVEVGARFVGEDPERASPGWVAHLAERDDAGAIVGLTMAVAVGEGQDLRLAARLAEGGAYMGLGVALAEEVEVREGLPETRFRMLGALKSKGRPALRVVPVPVGGGPREVVEAAVLGVPGAVAGALDPAGGTLDRLPMRDTPAAKRVGARPTRPAAPAG